MNLEIHDWPGYALLSSGDGRKLESFGGVLIDRPAPQAIWPAPPGAPWKRADAAFQRGEGGGGDWQRSGRASAESWELAWTALRFEIRLTGFGNVGFFPEHVGHWPWLAGLIEGHSGARGTMAERDREPPRGDDVEVLNLFAYTGGASLAAAQVGARVTHVDAARAVNAWAQLNAERSGLAGRPLRVISEDALKFARREARRGRRYHLLVIDPPTFGRGSKGEVWKIERDLHILLGVCADLLAARPLGLLLTAHSPGVTPAVLQGLLTGLGGRVTAGEMLLAGPAARRGAPLAAAPNAPNAPNAPAATAAIPAPAALPAGVYARWTP